MITQIGRHTVRHGNVLDAEAIRMLSADPVHILYSDPPWGDGNIKYWATMNKKDTGQEITPSTTETLLSRLFEIAVASKAKYVLVEYGKRWATDVVTYGTKHGLIHRHTIEIMYRSGSKMLPLDLHVFTAGNDIPGFTHAHIQCVAGMADYVAVREAVKPISKPGALIIDPFCGLGNTAQVAIDTGMIFRGNELNSKRLAKTIERIRRQV